MLPGRLVPWCIPPALYHIEGEATRRGDGIYDRMRPIGAHEVLVENSSHDRHLWNASDAELEQFLLLAAQRIQDLKARRTLQVRKHFQRSRNQRRAGVPASHVPAYCDYICPAPGSVRTARCARILSEQGTLRFLRHYFPGNETGPARDRNSRRLHRPSALCSACAL